MIVLSLIPGHLGDLAHLIDVGLFLLQLGKGGLHFGYGLVDISSEVWETRGKIKAWNVYGGRRGGRRRRRGGTRDRRRRRRDGFLLRLDLEKEMQKKRLHRVFGIIIIR